MSRSSDRSVRVSFRVWRGLARPGWRRNVRLWARLVLGTLLVADLATALLVFKPWGGSRQDVEERLVGLREEAARRRQVVERLRDVVAKVEAARREADDFLQSYFLERRTVSSTVLGELDSMAKQAGLKQKEGSYLFEPIEGGEGLSMMTILASYEGSYGDLMHMLNLLDRSPRLLILSDLQAAPQASGQTLNVTMRLNAFVRDYKERPPGREAAQGEQTNL